MSATAVARAVEIIRSFRYRTGESIFAFHAKRSGATSTYLLLQLRQRRRRPRRRPRQRQRDESDGNANAADIPGARAESSVDGVLLRDGEADAAFEALEETCEHTVLAEALYRAPFVVLAHKRPSSSSSCGASATGGDAGRADPILDYGNAYAQRLWRMDWPELTRTPSSSTAAVADAAAQAQRQRLLDDTRERGVSFGYRGTRVDSHGVQFTIDDVVVWNTALDDGDGDDDDGRQAATFAKWTYVE